MQNTRTHLVLLCIAYTVLLSYDIGHATLVETPIVQGVIWYLTYGIRSPITSKANSLSERSVSHKFI